MNQGWMYHDQVHRAASGLTLLQYYGQRYRHSSVQDWQERINSGQVRVDGQPATINTQLQVGQQLTYHRPPWQEPKVPLTFEVLYDDRDLLIIAKPAGLPVLPGGGFLEHTLWGQLQQHYPHETPIPIHRLGRGTSGLVLMARTAQARADLSRQMRDRQIHKVYRALVGAGDMPAQFTMDHPIGKIADPTLGHLYGATPQGRSARSDCRVLQRTPNTTLVEVTIYTGRPHQIRIHLAAAGYPLIGDPLYLVGGIPRTLPIEQAVETKTDKLPVPGDCGYHLHAYTLTFTHPRTAIPMQFKCSPPTMLSV